MNDLHLPSPTRLCTSETHTETSVFRQLFNVQLHHTRERAILHRLHLNSSVKYVHAIARLSTCPFEAGFKTIALRHISRFLWCRSLQYTLTIKTHRFIRNCKKRITYIPLALRSFPSRDFPAVPCNLSIREGEIEVVRGCQA